MDNNIENFLNMDYDNGKAFLKQLGYREIESCADYDHNINGIDYILDEKYENDFGNMVCWTSYWESVDDDEPTEILKNKAHWEIYDNSNNF